MHWHWHWHWQVGHPSHNKMPKVAAGGSIPSALAMIADPPACPSFLFSKATRKSWWTTTQPSKIVPRPAKAPGDCVDIDQLKSSTNGRVEQIKGRPTMAQYGAATTFIDAYSRLGYVHLPADTSSASTLVAKTALESYATLHGISVQHNHADTGRFAENAFTQAVTEQGQSLSFCGINAHHQNAITKICISELQKQVTSMLIHTSQHWQACINAHLWPYAIHMATSQHNSLPPAGAGNKSPIKIFTNSPVQLNIKHYATFGCPAYVLKNYMQAQRKINKSTSRAKSWCIPRQIATTC
jgi:hypothetical protein